MAGFLALSLSDVYVGSLTLTNAEVENGVFVVPDFAASTATIANATTGDGDVYFVANENTNIDEYGIDDVDFKVKQGKYLRLHKPQVGEVFVTTKFNGTLNKGDTVAVGVNGAVEAIGARTPKVKFKVKEVTTAYGVNAVSLIVVQ